MAFLQLTVNFCWAKWRRKGGVKSAFLQAEGNVRLHRRARLTTARGLRGTASPSTPSAHRGTRAKQETGSSPQQRRASLDVDGGIIVGVEGLTEQDIGALDATWTLQKWFAKYSPHSPRPDRQSVGKHYPDRQSGTDRNQVWIAII